MLLPTAYFGRLELNGEQEGRKEERRDYLVRHMLAYLHAAHPQVADQQLARGMRQEVLEIGGHGQRHARPVRPVDQVVGEQLCGQLVVLLVALVEEADGESGELVAVALELLGNLGLEVVQLGLARQRLVELGGDERLGHG